MLKVLGYIVFIDGILSLLLVTDRRMLWQIGRIARMIIGLTIVGLS